MIDHATSSDLRLGAGVGQNLRVRIDPLEYGSLGIHNVISSTTFRLVPKAVPMPSRHLGKKSQGRSPAEPG